MPVSDGRLLKELTKLDAMENAVDDLLDRMGVPTIRVSFEKLFSSSDVSEWTRLFGELGIGPTNLTRSDIDRADRQQQACHITISLLATMMK